MGKSMFMQSYVDRMKVFREVCAGKRILHLGCSSGKFIEDRIKRGDLLHAELAKVTSDLHGLDLDAESIKVLQRMGFDNLWEGNAEDLGRVGLPTGYFDVVVAGDLLEHITNPGRMLDGIKALLRADGVLLLSTNNAFGINYQARRWLGVYSEHPEHVVFYSPETLVHTFQRHGYVVDTLYGAYTVPPYTALKKAIFFLGSPLLRIFPVLAGTLVVVARIGVEAS
jgi:2-polyprenyl-3-methyl-5-hydroxy-6-metoxy-1,4-benzoquinol methylase